MNNLERWRKKDVCIVIVVSLVPKQVSLLGLFPSVCSSKYFLALLVSKI